MMHNMVIPTIAPFLDDDSVTSRSSSNSGIEVDDRYYSDGESFIAFDDESEERLVQELGRLYLTGASEDVTGYVLPVDTIEQERLDLMDTTARALTSKAHFAPVRNPARIMDIGTGTGLWCEEMARMFPDSEIIGTDLFPMPTESRVHPENIKYIIEDARNPDWGKTPYSYIHTKFLLGCFENFKNVIQRSYDYLEPGGYMESFELDCKLFSDDGSVSDDNPFLEWCRLQQEAQMLLGRPLRIANKLKQWYIDVGFTDVHEEIYKMPINAWPRDPRLKTIGKLYAKNLSKSLAAFSLRPFAEAFGWSQDRIEVAIVDARKQIEDPKMHAYHKMVIVYGRKPKTAPMKALPLLAVSRATTRPSTPAAKSPAGSFKNLNLNS